jgi:hypothetical protein
MEIWLILLVVGLVVGYLIVQARRVREHNAEVAEHKPFVDFISKTLARLLEIGPATWADRGYEEGKQEALQTLDNYIREGANISVPDHQRVYQHAYITLLESLYQEWEGMPYASEQEDQERNAQTKKAARFLWSIKDATYPPSPTWRQRNWQEYLFGPHKWQG